MIKELMKGEKKTNSMQVRLVDDLTLVLTYQLCSSSS
jgi:hypothetical protein